jgi:site-specific DNA-methyltransferase (adenine-specific)
MLRLRNEAELGNVDLPPHLLEQAKQQLAPQIPDVGDLRALSDTQLWSRVEQEHATICFIEKEIAERSHYVTAARYRRGTLLRELKPRCGRAFEKECKARQITSQRASEDMRIAEYFPSEAEAGKVPVRRALALISSGPVVASAMLHGGGGDPTDDDDERIGDPVSPPAHRHAGDAKDPDTKGAALGGEGGNMLHPAMAAESTNHSNPNRHRNAPPPSPNENPVGEPRKLESNRLYRGDCRDMLPSLLDSSVDLVLTDGPYFICGLGADWDTDRLQRPHKGAVQHLPSGMKFDPEQGRKLYSFYLPVCRELFRVLKPGGYCLAFAAPRLYHRLASALEDAGFQIRDEMIWLYTQSRAKAQGMDRFIHKAKGIAAADQAHLRRQLAGWKTPQLRCNHEPICLAQKPLQGTFLANQIKYGVGLVNTSPKVGDGKFVSNVVSTGTVSDEIDRHFLVPKPTKDEKGDYNTHKTVKPLELFRHLILLTTAPGALVLDPFIGSGTTALACRQLGRDFIGMEMNEEYLAIAERRLDDPVPKVRG